MQVASLFHAIFYAKCFATSWVPGLNIWRKALAEAFVSSLFIRREIKEMILEYFDSGDHEEAANEK